MGRVPESAAEDRLGVYGESKVSGEYGEGDQGIRLPARLRHSAGKRRDCQGDYPLHDVAAPTGQKDALLQPTPR